MTKYRTLGDYSQEEAQRKVADFSPETGSHAFLTRDIVRAAHRSGVEVTEEQIGLAFKEAATKADRPLPIGGDTNVGDSIHVLCLIRALEKIV